MSHQKRFANHQLLWWLLFVFALLFAPLTTNGFASRKTTISASLTTNAAHLQKMTVSQLAGTAMSESDAQELAYGSPTAGQVLTAAVSLVANIAISPITSVAGDITTAGFGVDRQYGYNMPVSGWDRLRAGASLALDVLPVIDEAKFAGTAARGGIEGLDAAGAGVNAVEGGSELVPIGKAGLLQKRSFVNRVYDSRFGEPGAQVSGPLGRSFTPGSGVSTTASEAIQRKGLNIFYPNNAQRAVIYRAIDDIPTLNRTSIFGIDPENLIDPQYFNRLEKVREFPLPR